MDSLTSGEQWVKSVHLNVNTAPGSPPHLVCVMMVTGERRVMILVQVEQQSRAQDSAPATR